MNKTPKPKLFFKDKNVMTLKRDQEQGASYSRTLLMSTEYQHQNSTFHELSL